MSKDDSKYQPVSCALYNEFELAIIHRQKLRLAWHEDGQTHIAMIMPLDLLTRDRQEFLIAQDHCGQVLHIRLDYIHEQPFIK